MISLITSFVAGLLWGVFWHLNFRSYMWSRWLWRKYTPMGKRAKLDSRKHRIARPWWAEWWDAELSHLNKYKGKDKANGPAFLFSTWILVGFTDAFHWFQLWFLGFVGAAVSARDFRIGVDDPRIFILEAIIVSAVISTGFTVTFRGLTFIFKRSGYA